MSTFVLIEPDAFGDVSSAVGKVEALQRLEGRSGARGGNHYGVRRPVRGIEIKDDTYATMQVRDAQGIPLPLFDAAAEGDTGRGVINSNFLIQQITEQRLEKQQIVLTFGEPYIFFFGEHPRMLNISGVLLNTADFNWRAEWWENYDRYLRGTACVRSKTRVYLSWDDIVVEGYVTKAAAVDTAAERNFVQFQFELFLTNYQNISSIGDPYGYANRRDMNLDPSKVSFPSTGDLQSKTALVRQANIEAAALSRGEGAQSLLSSLRQGRTQDLSNWLMEVNGQIVDTLAAAGRFISGRNIRVPVGYQGSAAFDTGVQLALASIPGATAIVSSPSGDRTVSLSVSASPRIQGFAATLGKMFTAYVAGAGPGQALSANTDEFVARLDNNPAVESPTSNLFDNQLIDDQYAGDRVDDIFRSYGVSVETSKELNLLFKKAMFGVAGVGVGMNLNNAPGLRAALNIGGSIL